MMENKDSDTLLQEATLLLKNGDKHLNEADVEFQLRKKQIEELKPKKIQLEEKCKELFGCSPSEVPQKILDLTQETLAAIKALNAELEAVINDK